MCSWTYVFLAGCHTCRQLPQRRLNIDDVLLLCLPSLWVSLSSHSHMSHRSTHTRHDCRAYKDPGYEDRIKAAREKLESGQYGWQQRKEMCIEELIEPFPKFFMMFYYVGFIFYPPRQDKQNPQVPQGPSSVIASPSKTRRSRASWTYCASCAIWDANGPPDGL